MQKIVLDTNVLVSALIQKSFPYLIVYHLYFEGKFELCVSKDLLAEYLDREGPVDIARKSAPTWPITPKKPTTPNGDLIAR